MDKVFEDQKDALKFWSQDIVQQRYPNLREVAVLSLSVFHGPAVESSFNVMDDVVSIKCSQTSVSMYALYQTEIFLEVQESRQHRNVRRKRHHAFVILLIVIGL